jgi:hypothetical protein
MAKDPDVRIADTIAFIRNADVPSGREGDRAIVADMLRDRETAGTLPDTASPAMSQGHNFAVFDRAGAKEFRNYRRAIILIRMVLQDTHATEAPSQTDRIADANLRQALGDRLREVCATRQDLIDKLHVIKTRPLDFLTNHNLQIMGARGSGGMPYDFVHDPSVGHYKLVPPDMVGHLVALRIDEVFHVPVVRYADLTKTPIPGGGGQTIDVPGHPVTRGELMVTTQLTGCAIVYHHAAGLVAAHVLPFGAIRAEAMCTELRNSASLIGAPGNAVTGVFGAQPTRAGNVNNYELMGGGTWVFCLGVNFGGAWSLYAQQRPKAHAVGGARTAWQIV